MPIGGAGPVIKAIYQKLLGGIAVWPELIGKVYYVDGVNGDNGNSGITPNTPWLTITHALTQCVNDRGDYIIVLEHWREVVAINRTRVHIIGATRNPNHSFVQMNAVADTAIFTVSALSNHCEIAGFSFGGGANHAGIENAGGTPMGLYIHDCQFGHVFAGDTPQDGIRVELNATNIRIEKCSFYGAPAGKGTLTRDGIRFQGGGDPLNGAIRDCQFLGLPGVGIDFVTVAADTGGITIQDNVFACDADTQGAAITLGANCAGFLCVGNKAMWGASTAVLAQNPYLDSAIAGRNHWVGNWLGNAVTDPV